MKNIPYLIALIDKLMSTSNELKSIHMIEFSCDLVSKKPASPTRGNSPSINFLWVTPDQVAESSFVGYLLCTSNNTNLIDSANLWTQSPMNAKNFSIDNGGQYEEVKNLAAGLPN
jgi:hypothetical protein